MAAARSRARLALVLRIVLLHALPVLLISEQQSGRDHVDAAPMASNSTASEQQLTGRMAQLAGPQEADRLRKMFLQSQLLAIQNYHEHGTLQSLSNASPGGALVSAAQNHSIHVIPLAALGTNGADATSGPESHQFVFYQNLNAHLSSAPTGDGGNEGRQEFDATKNQDAADEQADSKLAKLIHRDANFKNDARQSSLFPGLMSPGFGNSFNGGGLGGVNNPLLGGMSNLLAARPPTLPSLSSLPKFKLPSFGGGQQQQQLPRAPKTSIIGNSGGSMALTNDNVVVVNVLSGNY